MKKVYLLRGLFCLFVVLLGTIIALLLNELLLHLPLAVAIICFAVTTALFLNLERRIPKPKPEPKPPVFGFSGRMQNGSPLIEPNIDSSEDKSNERSKANEILVHIAHRAQLVRIRGGRDEGICVPHRG